MIPYYVLAPGWSETQVTAGVDQRRIDCTGFMANLVKLDREPGHGSQGFMLKQVAFL